MRRFLLLIVFATAAAAPPPGAGQTARDAPKPRGLWFWAKPDRPHGAVNVMGNPKAEAEALDVFRRWNIRRLYGSYATLPVEQVGVVGRWNRKLHGAGIRSEALFSDNDAITPRGRAALLRLVDERVVQFNRRCADPRDRFDGIALDIEPHAMPSWKTATAGERRGMLEDFLTTCTALRAFLDAHHGRELALSAALACWLDRLPPDGRVGWKSPEDLQSWFTRLAGVVPSISLMAYERSRPEAILEATAWERTHFPGRTITALRARLGVEWSTLSDLQRVLPRVEAAEFGGIDLENYELIRAAESEDAPPL